MKHQTINLVKFKALSKRLGMPLWQTTGLLESLWLFCQHNCQDGVVSRFTPLEIAGWMELDCDPSDFIEALVETRWLDRHDNGELHVHDWHEHKPNWLKGIEATGHPRYAKHKPGTEPGTEPGSVPSTVPSLIPSLIPSLEPSCTTTLPNPPLPNPTKPSPTQPAKSGGEEWGRVVSELLSEGVVAAGSAVAPAKERGATPEDVRAVLAHFRTIRRQLDKPEATLYARLQAWYAGQPPGEGWPRHSRQSPARYHEAQPPPAPDDFRAAGAPISEFLRPPCNSNQQTE